MKSINSLVKFRDKKFNDDFFIINFDDCENQQHMYI